MVPGSGEGTGRPRSWARLDLGAFAANIARARSLAPDGRILAVLKADAYGHGALHLAPVAEQAGVAMIGVGDSTEALELRGAGIRAPLLVLGDLVPSEIPDIVGADVIPVVHSEGRLQELDAEAARQGRRLRVHLKVDTGMGRLGMQPSRVVEIAREAQALPHVVVDGLMTHLAAHGRGGLEHNRAQARLFQEIVERLEADGIRPPNVHFRNSVGLSEHSGLEGPHETLARAGALLYGFAPGEERAPPRGFRPVLSLRTQLVFLKDVPRGSRVGYDGTFMTRRPTRLGVIPFGYHDGMPRGAANNGHVLIRGRRAPIVGKVSMDYTTIDITHAQGCCTGDEVTIIGGKGGLLIPVEELAAASGSSAYDILCSLGRRVVREPVGAEAARS